MATQKNEAKSILGDLVDKIDNPTQKSDTSAQQKTKKNKTQKQSKEEIEEDDLLVPDNEVEDILSYSHDQLSEHMQGILDLYLEVSEAYKDDPISVLDFDKNDLDLLADNLRGSDLKELKSMIRSAKSAQRKEEKISQKQNNSNQPPQQPQTTPQGTQPQQPDSQNAQTKSLLNLNSLTAVQITNKSNQFTAVMGNFLYKAKSIGGQIKIVGVEEKAYAMSLQTNLMQKLNGQALVSMISLGKTFTFDDTADTFITKKMKKVSKGGYSLTQTEIDQIKFDYEALKPFLIEFKNVKEKVKESAIARFKELNTGKISATDTFQVNFSWIDIYSADSISQKLQIIVNEVRISPFVGEIANMAKSQVLWMNLTMQEAMSLFVKLCYSSLKLISLTQLPGQTKYKYVDGFAKLATQHEYASTSRFIPLFFLTSGKEYKLTLNGKQASPDKVSVIGKFINEIIASHQLTVIGKNAVSKITPLVNLGEDEIQRADKWWAEIKKAVKTVPIASLGSKRKTGADITL